ncbi:PREDICTED: reticulon-like protein B9 [Nelumbo nucifera]|uniref:Reticulon-like protein n=1 Tax=Nelumbo nucifera TaxID=4432 RepID=A0A1U7ZNP6_NELNU|nr:PREDICTED: reticulon-like protein B9 [Nelumbo nucifera]
MSTYDSSSDSDEHPATSIKLFGRQRPLHAILGGGRAADVLLWRNKKISAAVLIGVTSAWFLFEVVEYNLITLLCYLCITTMIFVFAWCNVAHIFLSRPPEIHINELISESRTKEIALIFRTKLNSFLSILYDIARGKDIKLFILFIAFLWIVSALGTYFSTLNLLYLGFLCIQTLPALYERYEHDVDQFASKGNRDMKKFYQKLDSKVLIKIPRRPVKKN